MGRRAANLAEAPVPIVEIRSRSFVPGGAANAAANVVSLAGKALLGGVVGTDHPAGKLAEVLQRQGVDTAGLISDSERTTTTKTRLMAHSQQVVRMDSEQRVGLSRPVEDALLRWVDGHLRDVDACILSDYGKGVVSARVAEHVVGAARQVDKPVIVDPKGTNYVKYRGAAVIKPNIHEVQQVLKEEIEDDTSLLEASRRLVQLLEGSAVLITRGPEGMSLFAKALPLYILPPSPHRVRPHRRRRYRGEHAGVSLGGRYCPRASRPSGEPGRRHRGRQARDRHRDAGGIAGRRVGDLTRHQNPRSFDL